MDPTEMGLGPVHAIAGLLKGNNMKGADYWEINEAFACQVMACLKAYADPEYMLKEVGIDAPLEPIDTARLNVDVAYAAPPSANLTRTKLTAKSAAFVIHLPARGRDGTLRGLVNSKAANNTKTAA